VKAVAVIAAGVIGIVAGAGAAARADGSRHRHAVPARTKTVPVSGVVARSCPGPIIVGRLRNCSDRAVFVRGRTRRVVHGKFRIRLRPGTYRVTVDTCAEQQTLSVRHAIRGLSLFPRCPIPLLVTRRGRFFELELRYVVLPNGQSSGSAQAHGSG